MSGHETRAALQAHGDGARDLPTGRGPVVTGRQLLAPAQARAFAAALVEAATLVEAAALVGMNP